MRRQIRVVIAAATAASIGLLGAPPAAAAWTAPVASSAGTADCGFSGSTTIDTSALQVRAGTTVKATGQVELVGGREVARFDCRTVHVVPNGVTTVVGSRPLLLVATEFVQIDGRLQSAGTAGGVPTAGPGGANGGPGGKGATAATRIDGLATPGTGVAAGGAARGTTPGAAGAGGAPGTSALKYAGGGGGGFGPGAGGSFGALDFAHLHGGSGGGGGAGEVTSTTNAPGGGGGGGGGAIAIITPRTLRITAAGSIDVTGGGGGSTSGRGGGGGGGGGGAVLLSAPAVLLDGGSITAAGGPAGSVIDDFSGYGGAGGPGHVRIDTNWVLSSATAISPSVGPPPPRPAPDPVEAAPVLVSGSVKRVVVDRAADPVQTQRSSAGPFVGTRVLSDDGRLVVFSTAVALSPGDTNDLRDVYAFDRIDRRTELISHVPGDTATTPPQESFDPQVSADGRYVVFRSRAELAEEPSLPDTDIFRYDREQQRAELITVGRQKVEKRDDIGAPFGAVTVKLSADGSTVVMGLSNADRLSPLDNDFNLTPYAWRNGVVTPLTINRAGTATTGGADPDVSGDGNVVTFRSAAGSLVATPKVNCGLCGNVFVRYLDEGVTEMISVVPDGSTSSASGPTPYPPVISRNGRFVAYWSNQNDTVDKPKITNTNPNVVYLRDLDADTTELVSVKQDGTEFNVPSGEVSISGDGRYVGFSAANTNAHPTFPDTTNKAPIRTDLVDWCQRSCHQAWVRDTVADTTIPLSRSVFGEVGHGGSTRPEFSVDGGVAVFMSSGINIAGGYADGVTAIYRTQLSTGVTEVVSRVGGAPAFASLSGDGTTVAFDSGLDGLADGDTDGGLRDIYVSTVNPAERGIAPIVIQQEGRLVATGHVPCPGTQTRVRLTVTQGSVRRARTARVACGEANEPWRVSMPAVGFGAGPALACAVATTKDRAAVVNRVEWCRPVTISTA